MKEIDVVSCLIQERYFIKSAIFSVKEIDVVRCFVQERMFIKPFVLSGEKIKKYDVFNFI